jgi:hypothetical protein
MHPDKALGPDGFNPTFYQHFWNVCGDDIYVVAKERLGRGYFPSSLNKTNICLIPKCETGLFFGKLVLNQFPIYIYFFLKWFPIKTISEFYFSEKQF